MFFFCFAFFLQSTFLCFRLTRLCLLLIKNFFFVFIANITVRTFSCLRLTRLRLLPTKNVYIYIFFFFFAKCYCAYILVFQVDAALFASGEGKNDQSSAMSDLTKEVREAMAVEEGEEPTEGRYNEHDVAVSRKPYLSAGG